MPRLALLPMTKICSACKKIHSQGFYMAVWMFDQKTEGEPSPETMVKLSKNKAYGVMVCVN